MAKEFISRRTRLDFREYFVGTSLAVIDDAFRAAGLAADPNHDPQMSGQRRSLVEQYYSTVDFTRWDDARKVLGVYESVLDDLELRAKAEDAQPRKYAVQSLAKLLRDLGRDGFQWHEGRLVPESDLITVASVRDAVAGLTGPEVDRQLARLRESANDDPGLAVGTAKEILETTCKTILEECGVEVGPDWDMPVLLKETRKRLKLLPDDIPASAKGADTIRRLLSNLGQLGIGLSELRNLYGTGHGRNAKAKGLSPRHARLAVGAVSTLVLFLFETHRERHCGGA